MTYDDSPAYLSEQIITYLGNKRGLLGHLFTVFSGIRGDLGGRPMVCADLFSGSGVVARLMKQFSSQVIANDLEHYSQVINSCYLSNASEFDAPLYEHWAARIGQALEAGLIRGPIAEHYAPRDDRDIGEGERAFFTTRNAMILDTLRQAIGGAPQPLQKYFLAPLLYEASVHNNTGGVFKGFYKGRDNIGRFGGDGQNALTRILGEITLPRPVFSRHETGYQVHREDANALIGRLPRELDLLYIDPPYNQHPYGSNYFMLNTVAAHRVEGRLSRVSGIPAGWNRSQYNRRQQALPALEGLIAQARCRYIVLSYNSEGFIAYPDISAMLARYGAVSVHAIKYNAYRASRNLAGRPTHVKEYIFVLKRS